MIGSRVNDKLNLGSSECKACAMPCDVALLLYGEYTTVVTDSASYHVSSPVLSWTEAFKCGSVISFLGYITTPQTLKRKKVLPNWKNKHFYTEQWFSGKFLVKELVRTAPKLPNTGCV